MLAFVISLCLHPRSEALVGRRPLILADQNLTLSRVVGRPDEAFFLHALDQRGCAIIADAEPPLDVARGCLAIAEHDGDGLVVQLIAAVAIFFAALAAARLFVVFLLGDRFEIGRRALPLQMANHLLDLLIGDKGSMHAHDAGAARHI